MYKYEKDLISKGFSYIAGCDEVGRGPLAGPVVCAAVILNPKSRINGLDDSKVLSAKKREQLAKTIKRRALAYSIAYVYEDEIDRINIYQASKKGMIMAVNSLSIKPEYILTDAMPIEEFDIPVQAIIKGDATSASIAAASIIAKVERDAYMDKMDELYPGYGFSHNKGYPTKEHFLALEKLGVSKIHRKTYKPVNNELNKQLKLDI